MPDDIFDEVSETVEERRERYGPPQDSFELIANVWSGILEVEVTSQDVALCMAGLKLIRESHGGHSRDNLIDVCGYMDCLNEIETTEEVSMQDSDIHRVGMNE